jgi:hypothetical protein
MNCGLMKSVYDFVIKGSRLKCSDYKRRKASKHFRNKKKEYLKVKND